MGKRIYNISDLPSDYPEQIVSMMKDEGMSIKEVCAEFGITAAAHATFKKDDAAYSKAIDEGISFAEAWWMKQGRENLQNKGFNVGIYAFQMKNRFKWRDTPLVAGGNERSLADDFKEKEIVEQYKKKEKEDEKSIGVIN